MSASADQFEWKTYPEATALVARHIDSIANRNIDVERLRDQLLNKTGTRLTDWVDSLTVSQMGPFEAVGFRPVAKNKAAAWRHPDAMLPDLYINECHILTIEVDDVVDYLHANRLKESHAIEGTPGSDVRRASITTESNDTQFHVVERHGSRAWSAERDMSMDLIANHLEAFRLRNRDLESDAAGFAHASQLAQAAISDLGRDRACDLFFTAERDYWQNRNDAGRIQKQRQDQMGLGWGNHDHHTYRSSRASFPALISFLEQFGFECRERFYAGKEAGWGAQVLEHAECGLVVFADVDLSHEELAIDFAHEPLPEQTKPGTVGLWCALHGDAFLQAGMHHLECQFDFDVARIQLAKRGYESMSPFTDFDHLKQAFTVGQRWDVPHNRLNAALEAGYITTADADRFREELVIGSHLEILQRNDGYKGFNKTGISDIILQTDPKTN